MTTFKTAEITPAKKVLLLNFEDMFGVSEGTKISRTIHELILQVQKRMYSTIRDGDLLPSLVGPDAYTNYVSEKLYGKDNSSKLANQLVQVKDTGSTSALTYLSLLKESKEFKKRLLGEQFTLVPYVESTGAKKFAEEFGLNYQGVDPETAPAWRQDKVLFHEDAVREGTVPTVPDTIVAAKENCISVFDAVTKLLRKGYNRLYLRKARGAAGRENIMIEKVDDTHYLLGIEKQPVTNDNLESFLREWNHGNRFGVLVAPLFEEKLSLSGVVSVNDDESKVVYLGEEVTENHCFQGYISDSQKLSEKFPKAKLGAENCLRAYGELRRKEGYRGLLQMDIIHVQKNNFSENVLPNDKVEGKVFACESNVGRITAVLAYHQALSGQSTTPWYEKIATHYAAGVLPSFAAFDHFDIHPDFNCFEVFRKKVDLILPNVNILIPPHEVDGVWKAVIMVKAQRGKSISEELEVVKRVLRK